MVLQTEKERQNKIFPLELYQRTYAVCIFTGKSPMAIPSVIVAWIVNISELSVKYRRIQFVSNINCKYPMDTLCR